MPPSLVVIVPRLAPNYDGLGGYTEQLWKWIFDPSSATVQLSKEHGWFFLVKEAASSSQQLFGNAFISTLPGNAVELAEELEKLGSKIVLLQFVGYGYDKKNGIAQFLADGIDIWKKKDPRRHLVLMFHELWVTEIPFWRRTYWLKSSQQQVVSRLLKLSTIAVTSNEHYRSMLAQVNSSAKIQVIPIGSNFSGAQPSSQRDWRSVSMFGLSRLDTIKMHSKLLKLMSEQRLIDKIVLAGASRDDSMDKILLKKICPDTPLFTAYNFDSGAIPELLQNCGLAMMNAKSEVIAKSGRFHFASSLGQVAIATRSGSPGAPLASGQSFLDYDPDDPNSLLRHLSDPFELEKIGNQAHVLESTYFSWQEIAKEWSNLLNSLP